MIKAKMVLTSLILLFIIPILSSHGEDAEEIFNKGVEVFKAGNYEEAADIFSRLIEMEPDNAKAYKNRGVAFMSLKKLDSALEDFKRAADLDPDLHGINSNIGAVLYYKHDYKTAVRHYDMEIAKNPKIYITYFNRALSNVGLENFESALADLDTSLKLNPKFEWGKTFRQSLLERMGKKKPIQKISQSQIDAGDMNQTESAGSMQERQDRFSVQVGAFRVKTNAIKKRDELKKSGYEAYLFSIKDKKGKFWYLVRIGSFEKRSKAEKICRNLAQKDSIKAIIRPSDKI